MSHGNDVLIHFRIRYHAAYGQNMLVSGNIEELGNWNRQIPLTYEGNDDYWSTSIQIPATTENQTIEYKYIVESCGNQQWEPEKNHVLNIGSTKAGSKSLLIEVIDTFRWQDSVMDAYTRSAFVDAINRREGPKNEVDYIKPQGTRGLSIYFSCVAPNVRSNQTLIVSGSCPELGAWDPTKGIKLNDAEFPTWTTIVPISNSSFPFDYKFAVMNKDGTVVWDYEANHYCPGFTQDIASITNSILCINQYFINPSHDLYHGFGVYAPIFSLRSGESIGIGQYTDIKGLVDVCNKIGASLIQLLPINDTTDVGEWDDSYPYRQVSCFALHPIYINLYELTGKLSPSIKSKIDSYRTQHENDKTLDYPAVYKFKMETLKEIFASLNGSLASDKGFKAFIDNNGKWLKSYSLYCHYREMYGTSDFHTWPEHSTITPDEVEVLCDKLGKDLHFIYWVQYICDQQFRESREYAASHHVALKGDLPIGVYLNSAECWAWPKNFRLDMCAGAPPDPFSDSGQNWGFPTYDWDFMESDNYSWWRLRLQRMSELFHALRVDHILGFFRIWEIPRNTCCRGMLGHFFPCNPVHRNELVARGLWDIDRYTRPYVRWHLLAQKFGNDAEWVSKTFFNAHNSDPCDDWYDFKEEYNNEKKIDVAVDEILKDDPEKAKHYKTCLFQLIDDVMLIADDNLWDNYYPRCEITLEHIEQTPEGPKEFGSPSWLELPEPQRTAMKEFYTEFTFKRQNDLWVSKAAKKLGILKNSTNMLICAEDLGQLTDGILQAIQNASLLSLRVQRMSKDTKKTFDECPSFQYLSVCCPSTHDCSSLRGWWEENSKVIADFWYNQLWRHDNPWGTCEPWISQTILEQHLYSNSMWAVFLLQDITGITQHLRRQSPKEEQINIPADPHHHWCYRFPYTLEELNSDNGFTNLVHNLVQSSHRI